MPSNTWRYKHFLQIDFGDDDQKDSVGYQLKKYLNQNKISDFKVVEMADEELGIIYKESDHA